VNGRRTIMLVVMVLVAFVAGVGISWILDADDESSTPRDADLTGIGDHWHAAIAVNVCGEWLPSPPEFHPRAGEAGINAGLHSHADGLIHVHPFASDETGANATVGRFIDYGGWTLSADELDLWDGVPRTNGEPCTTGPSTGLGKLQWKVGSHNEPWPSGPTRTGDPARYVPRNGDIVALYFLPEGSPLPEPPGANDSLDAIADLGGASAS